MNNNQPGDQIRPHYEGPADSSKSYTDSRDNGGGYRKRKFSGNESYGDIVPLKKNSETGNPSTGRTRFNHRGPYNSHWSQDQAYGPNYKRINTGSRNDSSANTNSSRSSSIGTNTSVRTGPVTNSSANSSLTAKVGGIMHGNVNNSASSSSERDGNANATVKGSMDGNVSKGQEAGQPQNADEEQKAVQTLKTDQTQKADQTQKTDLIQKADQAQKAQTAVQTHDVGQVTEASANVNAKTNVESNANPATEANAKINAGSETKVNAASSINVNTTLSTNFNAKPNTNANAKPNANANVNKIATATAKTTIDINPKTDTKPETNLIVKSEAKTVSTLNTKPTPETSKSTNGINILGRAAEQSKSIAASQMAILNGSMPGVLKAAQQNDGNSSDSRLDASVQLQKKAIMYKSLLVKHPTDPVIEAIESLRRLGYGYEQILEDSGCDPVFLEQLFWYMHIPIVHKKRVPLTRKMKRISNLPDLFTEPAGLNITNIKPKIELDDTVSSNFDGDEEKNNNNMETLEAISRPNSLISGKAQEGTKILAKEIQEKQKMLESKDFEKKEEPVKNVIGKQEGLDKKEIEKQEELDKNETDGSKVSDEKVPDKKDIDEPEVPDKKDIDKSKAVESLINQPETPAKKELKEPDMAGKTVEQIKMSNNENKMAEIPKSEKETFRTSPAEIKQVESGVPIEQNEQGIDIISENKAGIPFNNTNWKNDLILELSDDDMAEETNESVEKSAAEQLAMKERDIEKLRSYIVELEERKKKKQNMDENESKPMSAEDYRKARMEALKEEIAAKQQKLEEANEFCLSLDNSITVQMQRISDQQEQLRNTLNEIEQKQEEIDKCEKELRELENKHEKGSQKTANGKESKRAGKRKRSASPVSKETSKSSKSRKRKPVSREVVSLLAI